MARQGFRRNAKTIGRILKTDGEAELRAAASRVTARIPADQLVRVDEYVTDRKVIGIVVAADAQAKDGVATKAASEAGLFMGNP